jgi:hypothetical protein
VQVKECQKENNQLLIEINLLKDMIKSVKNQMRVKKPDRDLSHEPQQHSTRINRNNSNSKPNNSRIINSSRLNQNNSTNSKNSGRK